MTNNSWFVSNLAVIFGTPCILYSIAILVWFYAIFTVSPFQVTWWQNWHILVRTRQNSKFVNSSFGLLLNVLVGKYRVVEIGSGFLLLIII
jgi:hypothetical protein